MATKITNTLPGIPGYNLELEAEKIKKALSTLISEGELDKLLNLLQAIKDIDSSDDSKPIGEQLALAIGEKVDKTEYASTERAGIIKLHKGGSGNNSGLLVGEDGSTVVYTNPSYGTNRTGDGKVVIAPATETEINGRQQAYKPIVPATLKCAVESITGKMSSINLTDNLGKPYPNKDFTTSVNHLNDRINNINDLITDFVGVINNADIVQMSTENGIIGDLGSTPLEGIYLWIPDSLYCSIGGLEYKDSNGTGLFKSGYLYIIELGENKRVLYSQYDADSMNTSITRIENREKRQISCLNGFTKFSASGLANALVSKITSCLLFAEKDCPNGLCLLDSDGTTIYGTDKNGDIVPLYAEHLYVFSYIHHFDGRDDELRLAADVPVNTDGRHWLSGSEIAHPENAREYDIEGKLGDMYLNVETLCIYRCNGLSKNNRYEWAYIGQWQKTTDIRMDSLSKELQDVINNKAEKSVVDKLSNSVQSLISRPSGSTSGGIVVDGVVDTKLNIMSSNAIANSAVANEFAAHSDLISGIRNGLSEVFNMPYIPQITYDDNNPIHESATGGENFIDVDCQIFYPEIQLRTDSFALIPSVPSGSTDLAPRMGWDDLESGTCGTYEIWMRIKNTDGKCFIEFNPTKLADGESPRKETKIGSATFDEHGCICDIIVGSVELTSDNNGMLSFTNCNFYNVSGAIFLDNSAPDITIDSNLSETSTNPVQNKAVKSALDEKVSKEQYATTEQAGLIKLHRRGDGTNISGINVNNTTGEAEINVVSAYGLRRTGDGKVATAAATEAEIDSGTNNYKPIVPANLDYAVKKVVPNAENRHSTTPQRVGAWIDDRPIWRWVFFKTITAEERSEQICYPVLPVKDTNQVFVINAWGQAAVDEVSLCMIDDCALTYSDCGGFKGNAVADTSKTIIYGWIEFATPEINIA